MLCHVTILEHLLQDALTWVLSITQIVGEVERICCCQMTCSPLRRLHDCTHRYLQANLFIDVDCGILQCIRNSCEIIAKHTTPTSPRLDLSLGIDKNSCSRVVLMSQIHPTPLFHLNSKRPQHDTHQTSISLRFISNPVLEAQSQGR